MQDIKRDIVLHPDGVMHFGDDGVLRSYDGAKQVIDYFQLSPEQVHAFIERSKPHEKDHLWQVMGGADGRKVCQDEIFNPPDHIRTSWVPEGYLEKRTVCSPPGAAEGTDMSPAVNSTLEKRVECNEVACTNNKQCDNAVCFGGCIKRDCYTEGYCDDD